jgi:uncharacterized membrane protein YfhO
VSEVPFAIVEENETGLVSRDGQYRKADILSSSNNRTLFHATAPASGIIVLGNGYFSRDYRVFVNGKRHDYMRVNTGFLGIRVDAGNYKVEVVYRPYLLNLSLFMLFVGSLIAFYLTYKRLRSIDSAGLKNA